MRAKRRRKGVLLLVAALLILQIPIPEADAAASASDFRITGSVLEKYLGTERIVSIPTDVDTIGKSAFEDNQYVEKISMTNSVKKLKEYAFWGCNHLKTVSLGGGISEIENFAFANCKGLQEMRIPSQVSSIGIQAFADCVNLTDITIPVSVTDIHETAFDGCRKLTIHCVEGSYADKYAQAFYERQKEMPDYEEVEEQPVMIAPVTEPVKEPEQTPVAEKPGQILGSTSVVGNQAVVFIDNTSPKVYQGQVQEPEQAPSLNRQETDGFSQVPGLAKYCIVDQKTVADQAYYKDQELSRVVLPEGIEEIGEFAYARSSLQAIVLPDSVKKIAFGAFYHCDDFTGVTLPYSVETVEPQAFANTLWVERFMQDGTGGTGDFLISGPVLIAYRGQKEEIALPEGVRLIAPQVFSAHTELRTVHLPESLKSIGEAAFENCSALTEVTLPQGLSRVQDRAFWGCGLDQVTIPASVKELGMLAFEEKVQLLYEGAKPQKTYEASATRLYHEAYRGITDHEKKQGVSVSGVDGVAADLEGCQDAYTLQVSENRSQEAFIRAFSRSQAQQTPKQMATYDFVMTDQSEIPIVKLGRQKLTLILPIPVFMQGKQIFVVQMDRNGQLERVSSRKTEKDGVEYIQCKTNKLYPIALCTDNQPDSGEVLEYSTTIRQLGQKPEAFGTLGEPEDWSAFLQILKWTIGGGLLVSGFFFSLKAIG